MSTNLKNTIETDFIRIIKAIYGLEINSVVINEVKSDLGDYAIPCFAYGKQIQQSPVKIANEISIEMQKNAQYKEVSALNGFINIKINQVESGVELIQKIISDERFLTNNIGKGEKYLVEYSSPNIAKPFSIGHLRTTIIGNALKNIAIKNGYDVFSINHLGDWGTQFGKLITAYKLWGQAEKFDENPIEKLLNLYIKFHEEAEKNDELNDLARDWFKKLEDGDQEAKQLWKLFREMSINEFQKTYDLLGIKFDSLNGEAFYSDKMQIVIDDLKTKNLLENDNGTMLVRLEEENLPPALIIKEDGATLYLTRDLAAAYYRKHNYQFKKCIYVVGGEQSLHFKQLKAVLRKSGYEWEKDIIHVDFGMVLQNGKKMSTRKGTIFKLHDLLLEAISLAQDKVEQKDENAIIASKIGIGAIIYNDLKNYRRNDVEFNIEQALKFEGNTGPYLQYSIVRINSILEKNNYTINYDQQFLDHPQINDIIIKLSKYNTILAESLEKYDPSIIAKYLYEVAKLFSKLYASLNVSNLDNKSQKQFVLNLLMATKKVLIEGLNILGIEAVEKM